MEIAGTKARERERNREGKIYLLREARAKREKEKQGGQILLRDKTNLFKQTKI